MTDQESGAISEKTVSMEPQGGFADTFMLWGRRSDYFSDPIFISSLTYGMGTVVLILSILVIIYYPY